MQRGRGENDRVSVSRVRGQGSLERRLHAALGLTLNCVSSQGCITWRDWNILRLFLHVFTSFTKLIDCIILIISQIISHSLKVSHAGFYPGINQNSQALNLLEMGNVSQWINVFHLCQSCSYRCLVTQFKMWYNLKCTDTLLQVVSGDDLLSSQRSWMSVTKAPPCPGHTINTISFDS